LPPTSKPAFFAPAPELDSGFPAAAWAVSRRRAKVRPWQAVLIMDDCISGLLTDFQVIFERKAKSPSDLENDWVIIDVSDNETGTEELISADEKFLSDLDRHNEPEELEDKADPYVVSGVP
jgi:hypothetical protein